MASTSTAATTTERRREPTPLAKEKGRRRRRPFGCGPQAITQITTTLAADLDPAVEVDDVFVAHADAAGRHLRADGPGLVRAVDAVERRAEIHGARAERIFGPADHVARQVRPASQHLAGRGPIRPFAFVADVVHPRPGEAGPTHADAIAQGAAAGLHQVEQPLASIDDDRSRCFPAVVADLLLEEARIAQPAPGLVGLARILPIIGFVRRRAAEAAEQKPEEAAAVFALRRDAHRRGRRLEQRTGESRAGRGHGDREREGQARDALHGL